MNTIIAISIACIVAVILLAAVGDNTKSEETIEQHSSIGIGTNGRVGVKLNENLCVDPLSGQVSYCL